MIQITDIDGNVYDTVQVGNQVWLTENLKVTKFRNGDYITSYASGNWYSPDLIRRIPPSLFYPGYGQYYNLNAIQDPRELAPKGCKIPSISDINELTDYLSTIYSPNNVAMNALRSTRVEPTAHPRWDSSINTPTDLTGFSALPGGAVSITNLDTNFEGYGNLSYTDQGMISKMFLKLNSDSSWWFSLGVDGDWYNYGKDSLSYNAGSKIYFHNVRCLLDTKIVMIQ